MATSNFKVYNGLLNLYFMTDDELSFFDIETQDFYNKKYRVLSDYEFSKLDQFIEKLNADINARAENRIKADDEYYNLKETKISIENGYYMGGQIAISNGFKYLNKTNKKYIASLFRKIARAFNLWSYGLAYRYSNGETGFYKIKEY